MPNAVFPTLPIASSSKKETLDDIQVDRATDGTLRGRSFWAATKKRIKVDLSLLTAAQMTTLDTFYNTNRLLPIDLLWPHDGVTYTNLWFVGPPSETKRYNGGRADMTLTLEG